MRYGRTYLWKRMRRYRASLSGPDAFVADRSWVDCITSMSGSDLRQAQLPLGEALERV